MLKWITNAWFFICFLWKYVNPIYVDLMRIIKEVKTLGLDNDDSRKKVFQDITDCIQARGLDKVPDSVLNCSIELVYQIYQWRNKSEAI